MSEATIEIRGRRGPPDDPMASNREGTECVVRANIVGDRYLNAAATLDYDGRRIMNASQNLFHAFCRFTMGKPYRAWQNAADLPEAGQQGLEFQLPARVSTTEQNLLKSCFLTYLWIEPRLLGPTRDLDALLIDEFIMDYTGAPGPQPLIYFLPTEYQNPDSEELARLYELRILCRLTVTKDQVGIQRYFTSLVIPGIRASELGRQADRTWSEIKHRMLAAIRKNIRST